MAETGLSRGEITGLITRITFLGIISYFGIKWAVDALDPTRRQKKLAQEKASNLMWLI